MIHHTNDSLETTSNPLSKIKDEIDKHRFEYEEILDQTSIEKSDIAYLNMLV
ncbi:MAG: hypothetical protein ACK5L6_01035 [Anaerorhabdus sp.]|uniref:hypothetical protein n=1 Tax=Anaerorhabdus sp. TaxID=1872524 RepID=UPI003A8C0EFA